jgi:hypothetical protein
MRWWSGVDDYGNYEALTHTIFTSIPILNLTVTLIYIKIPNCNPTLTDTPITSSTQSYAYPITLNFIPPAYNLPLPQPYLQPIPPALVLFQSCLDPSTTTSLSSIPLPTQINSFGELGFGKTGFGNWEDTNTKSVRPTL